MKPESTKDEEVMQKINSLIEDKLPHGRFEQVGGLHSITGREGHEALAKTVEEMQLPDPIDLAMNSKKWARTSARELEVLSEREQGAT